MLNPTMAFAADTNQSTPVCGEQEETIAVHDETAAIQESDPVLHTDAVLDLSTLVAPGMIAEPSSLKAGMEAGVSPGLMGPLSSAGPGTNGVAFLDINAKGLENSAITTDQVGIGTAVATTSEVYSFIHCATLLSYYKHYEASLKL